MKKRIVFLAFSLLMCLMLFGCGKKTGTAFTPAEADKNEETLTGVSQGEYQYKYPVSGDLCADIFILDYGHIHVKLFRDETPYAVDNFMQKAKKGHYNGTLVSGGTDGYYFQGGKPLADEVKEESIWGGGFSNEISDKLFPTRGSLLMANQGTDGSNAMQFFFVTGTKEQIISLSEPLEARYGIGLSEYLEKYYDTHLSGNQLSQFYLYGGAPWLYGHNTVFGQVFQGFDVMDAVCTAAAEAKENIYIKKITIYEYI